MIYLRFQILEKWANLRPPLNLRKPIVLQLQGGFAPGPRWGLCARHGAVPPLRARTATAAVLENSRKLKKGAMGANKFKL